MDSLSYWLLFFSTVFAINISPGPDLIYVLSRTIAQGRKIGIASSIGTCTGAIVHIFAAALGISAILATSAVAFSVVKYIGAIYLIFLGIKAFLAPSGNIDFLNNNKPRVTTWIAFKQGVLVDIFNPKAAIFFMAFLPQFVRHDLGHPAYQIIVLGLLVILVAIFVDVLFILIAGQTTKFFRSNQKISMFLNRALGSIFIGLGIRLAFIEQRS
jgi:threonine/homoserine/homoserine lactone efflux protein